MKRFLIGICVLMLWSCSSDNDELAKQATVKLNFTFNWDGTAVTSADLSKTKYTNLKGTELSIDRLRYLLSRITITNSAASAHTFDGYRLVDLSNAESLTYTLPEKIIEGSYTLSFVFGFNNEDNKNGVYKDLNTATWNVPGALGGGYHFMQFDGKYTNTSNQQAGFNYHAIRAVDNSDPNNLKFENTFFTVDLGSITITNDATIEIKMNIAEWFKNPNEWDLNVYNTMLMPNIQAQRLMFANGQSGVFSLGTTTP